MGSLKKYFEGWRVSLGGKKEVELEKDTVCADSFCLLEVKDDLNREIWGTDDKVLPEVAERLLAIVDDFLKNMKMKGYHINDIVITGSLANYNWSLYSDIDLHVILDFKQVDDDEELVKELLDAKRSIWNRDHNITIKGYEVEIYIENRGEPHESTGVYSLKYDKWNIKPQKERLTVDKENAIKKAEDIKNKIDEIEKLFRRQRNTEAHEQGTRLKQKVKKMRRCGLESGGVHSVENLAFKILRRTEYIKKMFDLIRDSYDKKMSLKN